MKLKKTKNVFNDLKWTGHPFIYLFFVLIHWWIPFFRHNFQITGKHIKLKVTKSGSVGVWTLDLLLSRQGFYHWATQVDMVDSEQTRLVKIHHSHRCLKRPTKAKCHKISEKPFGHVKAISENCLGYQKKLFRIWEQEFTLGFIWYPKTFCGHECNIRN